MAQGDENGQLSKEDCDNLLADIATLRNDSINLIEEIGDTGLIQDYRPILSGAGHAFDILSPLKAARAARIAGKTARNAWKYLDNSFRDHIELVTRKAGVYTTGLSTGVLGNLDRFFGDVPLSASEAADMLGDFLSDRAEGKAEQYKQEVFDNAQRSNGLRNQWKDGGCERFD